MSFNAIEVDHSVGKEPTAPTFLGGVLGSALGLPRRLAPALCVALLFLLCGGVEKSAAESPSVAAQPASSSVPGEHQQGQVSPGCSRHEGLTGSRTDGWATGVRVDLGADIGIPQQGGLLIYGFAAQALDPRGFPRVDTKPLMIWLAPVQQVESWPQDIELILPEGDSVRFFAVLDVDGDHRLGRGDFLGRARTLKALTTEDGSVRMLIDRRLPSGGGPSLEGLEGGDISGNEPSYGGPGEGGKIPFPTTAPKRLLGCNFSG